MRYGPEHKRASRARILAAAARLFRSHGYESTGIDAVMAAAGLTPGTFYAHFRSKEMLLREVLLSGLATGCDRVKCAAAASADPYRTIVEEYLTPERRDNRGGGCPLPSLAADVARMSPTARRRCGAALDAYLDEIAPFMPGSSRAQRRRNGLATLSTLVGAMTLARSVSRRDLSDEILRSARKALLDARAAQRGR